MNQIDFDGKIGCKEIQKNLKDCWKYKHYITFREYDNDEYANIGFHYK